MAEKAALENPDHIGCFRIVKKIGEGSFGKVFLGKNSATESYAAIKSAKRSRDTRIMAINNRMIRAEASILGQLTHKNIVKLYQSIEEEGIHSMVIEFVSGIDLGKLLASEKTVFTEREASSIIKNILEGLEYLHSKNITHRDIKPSKLC